MPKPIEVIKGAINAVVQLFKKPNMAAAERQILHTGWDILWPVAVSVAASTRDAAKGKGWDWNDKLRYAVDLGEKQLAGKDFFRNALVVLVAAAVAELDGKP